MNDHEWKPTVPRYVVAFDHRNSLDRDLARIGASSTPELRRRIKLLVWLGVEQALPQLPDPEKAGILIDRGQPTIVAKAQDANVSVALALEASGHALLRADADARTLSSELRGLARGFGKVLLRWHPDDTPQCRRHQLDTLQEIDKIVKDAGARLLVELLVPNAPREPVVTESGRAWEETEKPRRQVEAVAEILGSGVAPELWKVEGHTNVDEAAALASTVALGHPDAAILLLGGGEAIPGLPRLFSCSAASDRFRGFAVGRSIWWEPIARMIRGRTTGDETREAIGRNFLAVADAFNSAAHSSPTARVLQRPPPSR